jgi:uncharacterized protein
MNFTTMLDWSVRLAREAFVLPVRAYQMTLARALPPACRFEPSCSEYMVQAIRRRGVFRGLPLGARRLLRCHPWGGSGCDPVK